MRYLAFRFAGCFATFLATGTATFAGFSTFTDFAGFADFAGFSGLADGVGFADAPAFAGDCLPALADCRLDRDDPAFTGIGMAAYTLLIFVS